MHAFPTRPLIFTLAFVVLGQFAYGQGNSNNSQSAAATKTAADLAWDNLGTLTKNAGNSPKTAGPVSAETFKAERDARANKFRQLAQSANDFAAQNPGHAKAREARKVEALAGLEGIVVDDVAHERTAVATAAAYRADKGNPASDRFEVAHAMDGRAISKKIMGRPWHSHAPMAEDMMDRLRVEFGHRPEVYGGYVSLAEHADCDNARDVALKIMQSPAPPFAKTAARRLLERYALVRQPLDFPLTPVQGKATTLAKEAGKTTVVVLYDGIRSPAGPPGLHDYKKNPRPNTQWIYIAIGTPPPLAKGAKPWQKPPGLDCVEALGTKSPLYAQLKLTQLPAVFVLDEAKKLSAYGRIDQMPWLFTGIGRPAPRCHEHPISISARDDPPCVGRRVTRRHVRPRRRWHPVDRHQPAGERDGGLHDPVQCHRQKHR